MQAYDCLEKIQVIQKITNPKLIILNIKNIDEKYKFLNYYQITEQIIQEYQLNLQKNTPMFDALLFTVRFSLKI